MEPTGSARLIDSAEGEDSGEKKRLSWLRPGSGPRLRGLRGLRERRSRAARCWSHQTSKFSFVQPAAAAVQCTGAL